nr:uncharacterized protein LOC105878172 [Microcebus murinus]
MRPRSIMLGWPMWLPWPWGMQNQQQGDQRTGRTPDPELMRALPLRAAGPTGPDGKQAYHYWPFSTSDLYNWKSQNANFSESLRDLINLLDSVLFTHQPTWDDCQQLLKVFFITEERERIQVEARKLVPGEDSRPTVNPRVINQTFPIERPPWDYNDVEGRECVQVYRQTLMAGLWASARKPTTFVKVGVVRQGPEESPSTYLERIMEAFQQYTPIDPTAEGSKAADMMAFVNQAAPDTRRKVQKIDRLCDKTLQDFLEVAEKVYNNREIPEEKL